MKKVLGIYGNANRHWVGDGFPVRSLFSYNTLGQHISPFLLLDYAGPADFPPAQQRRGVGHRLVPEELVRPVEHEQGRAAAPSGCAAVFRRSLSWRSNCASRRRTASTWIGFPSWLAQATARRSGATSSPSRNMASACKGLSAERG